MSGLDAETLALVQRVAEQTARRVVESTPQVCYRPGVVSGYDATVGAAVVVLDGDGDVETAAHVIVPGYAPAAGARVMCALSPPSLTLVVGVVGVALNPRMAPTVVNATAPLALAAGGVDVPGASLDVDLVEAWTGVGLMTFDFSTTSGISVGEMVVDGVVAPPQALSNASRATVSGLVPVSLGPGAHTIKLQARTVGGAGSAQNPHTGFTLLPAGFRLP